MVDGEQSLANKTCSIQNCLKQPYNLSSKLQYFWEWNGGTDNHYVETIPNTPKQMVPLATDLLATLDLQASLQTGS